MTEDYGETEAKMLWTTRHYPCGCKAVGPGDVPNYCSEHGDNDADKWLRYLEAEPKVEPYLSIAQAWRADKVELERLRDEIERLRDVIDSRERAAGFGEVPSGTAKPHWEREPPHCSTCACGLPSEAQAPNTRLPPRKFCAVDECMNPAAPGQEVCAECGA